MANFPRTGAEIANLAEKPAVTADYGAGHEGPAGRVRSRRASMMVVQGTLRQERLAKNRAGRSRGQHEVEPALRRSGARGEPIKLLTLGWGAPRERVALRPPGQVLATRVAGEGATWIMLEWREPVDGVVVAAYEIQRRLRDGGEWEEVATSVDTKQLLDGQPRGVELEYRVVALNKAGSGSPREIGTAVL